MPVCRAEVKHPREATIKGRHFLEWRGSSNIPSLTFCISMLSGTESGVFGSWLRRPWSSVQYSGAELGHTPLSHHPAPPVYPSATHCERACVCMYITIIVPSNPRHPCSAAPPQPPRRPACSQSWHGTISYLPPARLPGLRGTGSLTLLLPLSSLQPSLPLLSHEHSLRSLHCHLSTTLQLRLLLTLSCKEYFTPSLFVCMFTSHGWLDYLTSLFLLIFVISHIVLLVAA